MSCGHCGSKNHATDDCPHGLFSKECAHCGSRDHATDDCPHGLFSKECGHCGSRDHATDDCPHGLFSSRNDSAESSSLGGGSSSASSGSGSSSYSYSGGSSSSGGSGASAIALIGIIVALVWFFSKTDTVKQTNNSNQTSITPSDNSSQHEPERLYVNAQEMYLRDGPGKEFGEVDRLFYGEAVDVSEIAVSKDGGNWVKVTTDSSSGWLNKKYLSTVINLANLNQICINTELERIEIFKKIAGDNFELIGITSSRENGICNFINNMEIEKIDLNNDGELEFVASPYFGCGANNCDTYVFQNEQKEYEPLLVAMGSGIEYQNNYTNGYRDLSTKSHASSAAYAVRTYRYNGSKYKEDDCFLYQQSESNEVTYTRCSE